MMFRSCLVALALLATACGGSDGADDSASSDDLAPVTTAPADADADEPAVAEDAATTETSTDETTTSTTTTQAPVETTTAAPAIALPTGPIEVDCTNLERVGVGLQTGTFFSGEVEYTYQWTVPSTYVGEPIPVVLDFHGIGSNGAQQAVFSGWAAKAEAEGFLSVQPTGISLPDDDRASWELPQFDSALRDDVAMVVDLLGVVSSSVCIDPNRIYATGMSNGGFFTSELVCDLSGTIAAAVSVAGVTHHDTCMPSRAVPYLAFHGTADTTVPFAGGGVSTLEGADGPSEFFEQVMPDEFAEFAADFGCTESTDSVITAEVTLTSWTGCTDNVEVGFYAIEGAGHTWPGSIISSAIPSLGVTNLDIDATEIAWQFFQRHPLAE